jgi:hypothetical protein
VPPEQPPGGALALNSPSPKPCSPALGPPNADRNSQNRARARSAIGSLPAAQWGVVVTLFGNSSLISFSMREGVKKGHQGSPHQRLAEIRRRWRQASTDVSHSTRAFSAFKLLCHVVTPTCHAGCRFAACELPFSVICIQLRGCRI